MQTEMWLSSMERVGAAAAAAAATVVALVRMRIFFSEEWIVAPVALMWEVWGPSHQLFLLPCSAAAVVDSLCLSVDGEMRVGGGEKGSGLRGGGSKAPAPAAVVMRRTAGEEAERGGCSASSTSSGRGSSRGDSPLTSYVRGGGRARTDLEPDGGLLTSSSSYASAVSTVPLEEDDRASEGEKDERWVRHGRIQQPANNGVPRSNSGECQGRRNGRKDRAQRPVSLDFGCPGVARSSTHSPGFSASSVGVMNKGLGVPSHYRSDVLSSPGTPNYHRRGTVGYQQGCNSERVIPPANRHRRHPGSNMVLPYNGGRTLPSKWEDAEKNTMISTLWTYAQMSQGRIEYPFDTSFSACADVESETTKDSTASSFPMIVRKDVATQTSPDMSRSSSPNRRPSISRSLSVQQVKELESCFSKLEIRDVQIDDRVTLTRWSKKHVTRGSDKNSTNIIEWKKKTMESKSSAWEVMETAKCISK
ncbi:hypothetical protein PR202_ga21240 [Eleusine coracana subsp. coracana]|uniref:Uncharacterized protein n=1 Tax=Eleusine coracana subsp. coracana TaxID=191504 RepID=A0AAV5D0K3_ELECO|nr:hypothetical protein PR202_ga21240 [Eleusine coracana subsp. coracana]